MQRILEATPISLPHRPARKPDQEFFILFTARTGSSHLAELLTSAGIADVREWLHPAHLKRQADFFGATTFGQYFERMRSMCPQGIFGHKMTIWFYEAFSREVRLEDYFDFGSRCIFLFREDLLDQAFSVSLANRRQVFHQIGDAPVALPSAAYDPVDVMRCAEALLSEEQRLRAFVQQHHAAPRYLSYEQLVAAAPAGVVEAIAQYVGVVPDVTRLQSRHRKLDDPEHRSQQQRFAGDHAAFCESLRSRRGWLLESARAAPLLPG